MSTVTERAILDVSVKQGEAVAAIATLTQRMVKWEDAVKRSGVGLRRTSQDIGVMAKASQQLRSALGYFGISATFAGATAAASKLFSAYIEGSMAAADKIGEFKSSMTPLLSLGDNAFNARGIELQTLTLARGFGRAYDEVNRLRYRVQSGGADLEESVRNDIVRQALRVSNLMGGDAETFGRAGLKLMENYRDKVNGVTSAFNLLAYAVDRADVTPDELAVNLPDILPAAKMFGWDPEEVLAAFTVISRQMGSAQKGMTAFRNIILHMDEAIKKAGKSTGDIFEDIKMLRDMPPDILVEIFGNRSVAAMKALIDQIVIGQEELVKFREIGNGVDIISERTAAKMVEATTRMNAWITSMKQVSDTAAIAPGAVGGKAAQESAAMLEADRAGFRALAPAWLHGGMVEKIAIGPSAAARRAMGMRDKFLETGVVNTYLEIQKTRGKDAAEAYWKDMGGDTMFGRAGWGERIKYQGKEFTKSIPGRIGGAIIDAAKFNTMVSNIGKDEKDFSVPVSSAVAIGVGERLKDPKLRNWLPRMLGSALIEGAKMNYAAANFNKDEKDFSVPVASAIAIGIGSRMSNTGPGATKMPLYRKYGVNADAGTKIYSDIVHDKNMRDFGVGEGSVASLASELRGQSSDVNPVNAGYVSSLQSRPTITPEQGDQMIRYLAAIAQAASQQTPEANVTRPWHQKQPVRSASISRNAGIEAP